MAIYGAPNVQNMLGLNQAMHVHVLGRHLHCIIILHPHYIMLIIEPRILTNFEYIVQFLLNTYLFGV